MNWKISLDRYLTTPPDDGFDAWADMFGLVLSNEFFDENQDWIFENNGRCDKWIGNLFAKGKTPYEAARIIERAFSLYKCS